MGGVSWYRLVVYIAISAKRRAYFCQHIAIEMGGVSRYFSKLSGSGVDLTLLKDARSENDENDHDHNHAVHAAKIATVEKHLLVCPAMNSLGARCRQARGSIEERPCSCSHPYDTPSQRAALVSWEHTVASLLHVSQRNKGRIHSNSTGIIDANSCLMGGQSYSEACSWEIVSL